MVSTLMDELFNDIDVTFVFLVKYPHVSKTEPNKKRLPKRSLFQLKVYKAGLTLLIECGG